MFQPTFANAEQLALFIDNYFKDIAGEFHLERKTEKQTKDQSATKQKVWDREPEPATFTGLALFLGFESLLSFDEYLENGEFAGILRQGRLRVEASYEKKLHNQAPSGIIFALKNMGWHERGENRTNGGQKNMQIVVSTTGPEPAENEKDVVL